VALLHSGGTSRHLSVTTPRSFETPATDCPVSQRPIAEGSWQVKRISVSLRITQQHVYKTTPEMTAVCSVPDCTAETSPTARRLTAGTHTHLHHCAHLKSQIAKA